MGVQDLVRWVRTSFPDLPVVIGSRWRDSRVRGKRVAIDATLLTAAFYLRSQREDRPIPQGKGAILGWYQLVTEMRQYGVQPIAVWDERGRRSWKAAEARKRAATRELLSARRSHEDERAQRLQSWRETFMEFQQMSDVEREIFYEQCAPLFSVQPDSPRLYARQSTQLSKSRSGPMMQSTIWEIHQEQPQLRSLEAGTESEAGGDVPLLSFGNLKRPKSLTKKQARMTTQHVAEFVNRVSDLLERFKQNDKPWVHGLMTKLRQEVQMNAGNVVDSASAGSIATQRADNESMPNVVPSNASRDTLKAIGETGSALERIPTVEEAVVQELTGEQSQASKRSDVDQPAISAGEPSLPPSVPLGELYLETPNQTALSEEERMILQTFLGQPPSEPTKPVAPLGTTASAMHLPGPSDEAASHPRERLLTTDEAHPIPEHIVRLDSLMEKAPLVREGFEKRLAFPTAQDNEDCKELLLKMGVPLLEARIPFEAEGLAVSLAKADLVDFVATEDSDVLAYEGPMLRGVSGEHRPLTFFSGSQLRKDLEMSSSSFIDFCILLGTDASSRIPGIGPARAFKLIDRHGSIEEILAKEPKVAARLDDLDGYMESVKVAREVFLRLPPLPDGIQLEQGVWADDEVHRLLTEKHGLEVDFRSPPADIGYVFESQEVDWESLGDEDRYSMADEPSWDDVLEEEER